MATTDIEKLVVQLSADVRGYQKALDRARVSTNSTARSIESRFAKLNTSISRQFKDFGKGLISGAIGGFAVTEIVSKIGEVINSLAELHDQALKVGTSAEALKSLAIVAHQDGLEIDDLVGLLGTLRRQVDQAITTQKGPLFELFAANQKELSDDIIQDLLTIADLFKNARTETERQIIAAAGFRKQAADAIPLLSHGGDELRKMTDAEKDNVKGLNEMSATADDFADKWGHAMDVLALKGQQTILGILKGLENLADEGSGLLKILEHPSLFGKIALKDITGIDLGVMEQARREIGLQTQAQAHLATVTQEILQHELDIKEARSQGFGGSPLLKQLEAELDALKKSKTALEEQIKSGIDRDQQIADIEAQIPVLEAQLLDSLGKVSDNGVNLTAIYQAQLEKLQQQLAVLKQITTESGNISTIATATGRQGLEGLIPKPSTVVPGVSGGGAALDTTDLEKEIDKLVKTIIDFEDRSRNPSAKNPLSSATGVAQFIASTWLEEFKKAFPQEAKAEFDKARAAGLDPKRAQVAADEAILKLRENTRISIAVLRQYAKTNAEFLHAHGVAINQATLQLAHFLGKQGAVNVLKAAPGTPVSEVLPADVIAKNRGVLEGRTVDEVIREAEARAGLSGIIRDNAKAYAETEASIRELIDAGKDEEAHIKLENSLFGDHSLKAEKLRKEYELLTEAKNKLKGVRALTPDERKEIIAQADAIAEQTFQTNQLEESQKAAAASSQELAAQQEELNQTMEEVSGAFKDSLKGFIQDLIQGKSLTEALNTALTGLGEKLLDIALNNLFSGLGGGAGGGAGGLLSGLFHQGGIVGAGGSGRFVSPSVFAGAKRYHAGGLPGLMPGEVAAILKKGEIVLPNMDALKSIAQRRSGASGGTAIIQNNTFTAPDIRTLSRSGNQLSRSAAVNLERVRRVT